MSTIKATAGISFKNPQSEFVELQKLQRLTDILEFISNDIVNPSLILAVADFKKWLADDNSPVAEYFKKFQYQPPKTEKPPADFEEFQAYMFLPYIKADNKFVVAMCKLRAAISAHDTAEKNFDYWQDADTLTEQGKKAWHITLKARDYVLKLFYDQIVYSAMEVVEAAMDAKGFSVKYERIKEQDDE